MEPGKILLKDLSKTEFSVLDVETTGLSARSNHVIEIGIVKVKNLKVIDKYSSLINPGYRIPAFITQLTGITNGDVKNAPSFDQIADDIKNFIGDSIISGHNLSFDDSFLTAEYLRNERIPINNPKVCTLKIAKRLYPALRSKSLSSVAYHLKIQNRNSHRALGDAETTAKILIKMIKKLIEEDFISTADDLIKYQYFTSAKPQGNFKSGMQEALFACPDLPGVYYFINRKDEIIYVGKAKSLHERVKSYFSPSAGRKAKKIIQQARKLKYQTTNSELTALLMEAETIKKLNPRHNSQLKKYGNKYFLRITKNHKFPSVEIANHFDFNGDDYFGLYLSRKKAEVVKEIIDKTFAVRECSDKDFNKRKKCFLADIERCTAPCENSDEELYNKELNELYEFLQGKSQFALNRMLFKMKEYSAAQRFEKAGEIKSTIDLILKQVHQSSLLSEPVNNASVIIEISEKFSKDFIILICGKMAIESYPGKQPMLFKSVLDDYFNGTVQTDFMPTEEDLEKLKITMNWLIRNRDKVKIYYLKDFKTSEELYTNISNSTVKNFPSDEGCFEIKNLTARIVENSFVL